MADDSCYEARKALIQYAEEGLDPQVAGYPEFLDAYIPLLGQASPREAALTAILTTLKPLLGQDERTVTPLRLKPRPLALTPEVVLHQGDEGWDGDWVAAFDRAAFDADWQTLGDDPAAAFEIAAEVIRKHAWAVPGRLGQPCVSLYEEFKLLSALVHASGCTPEPAAEFTLIAGDFPGIQKAIYTITSKGAAKSLRGRSLFLQLLADGVVRRLLQELRLPWTNVVYVAGGNFVLLAPAGVEQTVRSIAATVNSGLLTAFQGDISLSMVTCTHPAQALQDNIAFENRYRDLKVSLGDAKQRPFDGADYNVVFKEQGGIGPEHCAVCNYDPGHKGELKQRNDDLWCKECIGFAELAQTFAQNDRFLSVTQKPEQPEQWQQRLFDLTQQWYVLSNRPPKNALAVYLLNDTGFRNADAHGFRCMAVHIPRDLDDSIRDFSELAQDSGTPGFKRIGILRMDIDNLGDVFATYLSPSSLLRISAASSAVNLFFEGWLNSICYQVEQDCGRPNSLYVVYAGGDDLFIVGPWDVMPYLAETIHGQFAEYVNGNGNITISAGIGIEDEKYPLYRAAERALHALDVQAKGVWQGLDGIEYRKNAICLLGQVAGWENGWPVVVQERDRMYRLLGAGLPKALVQIVLGLHGQYVEGLRRTVRQHCDKGLLPPKLVYGRWVWMQAYSLTRMAQRYQKQQLVDADGQVVDVRSELNVLQQSILTPQRIHLAGLAARWVDYLMREDKNK
ncbi:MAG: type III-A CRISPR-associated protein Cas10/Csm1 [Anaerolineae bacterium]|nr:type III-A CRISPR-associated protein Cas10/Csm1 [Anaerolineae bacterium]